jgi:RNA polymerase sigma-70 factor, ECF subfamily
MDLRDPLQFDAAYRRLFPLALNTATRVLHDDAAAEDVVQDVFMQLWLKPAAYDPKRGSLASYVTMMARSRAVDRWRTRVAREAAADRAENEARGERPQLDSAAEPVIRRERSATLLSALDQLPGEQRDAVLLAYGRGLTAQEIAQVTEIPLGTAKSRLRLGLRRARQCLEALEAAA